jgi:diguanylate cyclase (GGDEF)-like protein
MTRWTIVALTLCLIAAIGRLDFVTGPDIGLSLFYLLPILAIAWWLGTAPALVTAGAASLSWFLADATVHSSGYLFISIWNGFSRLVIFAFIAVMTSRARMDRDRFKSLLQREREQARVDIMTGLPNRRGFIERLMVEASRCRRSSQALCLAYLDLDNFKLINDRHGHSAGDSLLSEIGRALSSTIRAGDLAARLGGDEFAILFWNTDRGAVESIAQRIIDGIREVGRRYPDAGLGASVGIAHFERVPESVEEILRRADNTMYEAKSLGKGRLVVWRSKPVETIGDSREAPAQSDAPRPG